MLKNILSNELYLLSKTANISFKSLVIEIGIISTRCNTEQEVAIELEKELKIRIKRQAKRKFI